MRQNFSPHKHSFEDAPHNHSFLFIAHKRAVGYLYFEVKTTPYSGVISKIKKKRSSPVLLHLFHHFWPRYATKRDVKQVMTFFFFFGDVTAVTNFLGKICGHLLKLPKNQKTCNAPPLTMQCATVGHPWFSLFVHTNPPLATT